MGISVATVRKIEDVHSDSAIFGNTGSASMPLIIVTGNVEQLIVALKNFRDERDWAQFHNPKDLALAISIEAAELNELFLWRAAEDVNQDNVAEELADVFAYALLLLDAYNLDLEDIMRKKIEINEKNYPVHLSRGNADRHH